MKNPHDILSNHPLFADLAGGMADLAAGCRLRNCTRGEVIYRPGQAVCYAYLIVSGALKFEFAASDGQQVFVETVDKGFLVGELEILSGIDYHSTAICAEAGTLLLIPGDALLNLIAADAGFALKFSRQLATNFFFYQMIAAEREASGLKTRLANLLVSQGLRFGQRQGDSITLALSHEQLSEMLNASRQRVNMQLNQWQKEGLLQCSYGRLCIVAIEQFMAQSGFSGQALADRYSQPYGDHC